MAWSAARCGRTGEQVTASPDAACAGITFINAHLNDAQLSSLRIVGSRIAELGAAPVVGDIIVDLQGDRLLPGLINAHDHLQLNSLPCPDSGKRYARVQDWMIDIKERQQADASFKASEAVSRRDRLLIGGVKNLLSGVTTVAHHDPLYSFLTDPDYPTGIVTEYGWSHSVYIDDEAKVRASYQHTPIHWPWIIHAAEGTDEASAGEFARLEAMGCIGPNTLLVHGLALDQPQRRRLGAAGAGVIWCPSSNLRLFDKTLDVAGLLVEGRIAIGTDSRLSGARDLLEEIRIAARVAGLDDESMESLVTRENARLLHLSDRGSLRVGFRADLLVLPAGMSLSNADRADIRLVIRDGQARYGDRDHVQRIAPDLHWASVRVDGTPKLLDGKVAAMLCKSAAREDGLEILDTQWRAA
jgi:hypothetical protein